MHGCLPPRLGARTLQNGRWHQGGVVSPPARRKAPRTRRAGACTNRGREARSRDPPSPRLLQDVSLQRIWARWWRPLPNPTISTKRTRDRVLALLTASARKCPGRASQPRSRAGKGRRRTHPEVHGPQPARPGWLWRMNAAPRSTGRANRSIGVAGARPPRLRGMPRKGMASQEHRGAARGPMPGPPSAPAESARHLLVRDEETKLSA